MPVYFFIFKRLNIPGGAILLSCILRRYVESKMRDNAEEMVKVVEN